MAFSISFAINNTQTVWKQKIKNQVLLYIQNTRQHIKKSRTSRVCFDNPTGFLLKSKLMTYGNCSGIKIGKDNNLMK